MLSLSTQDYGLGLNNRGYNSYAGIPEGCIPGALTPVQYAHQTCEEAIRNNYLSCPSVCYLADHISALSQEDADRIQGLVAAACAEYEHHIRRNTNYELDKFYWELAERCGVQY